MAGEGDMKLLGLLVSPFVTRVRMALNMKGVSYEYIEQDPFNKSELLLKSNPVHKKVPVLIHNGKPILESLVIVQYVDEVWSTTGPSILPADPYDRAIARFWAAYVDDKLFPAYVGILKAATEEESAEKVNETLAAIGIRAHVPWMHFRHHGCQGTHAMCEGEICWDGHTSVSTT